MKRPGPPPGDLLNLPLTDTADRSAPLEEPLAAQDLLPFDSAEPDEIFDREVASSPRRQEAGFGRRLRAGLLDVISITGALVIAAAGAWTLGATPDIDNVPAFLLFTASFSFLYTIVPLTFWGQTPGMAIMHLVARAGDAPLTIQQAVRRWLGAVTTVVFLGLPFLLALSGRSLADRLSNSRVSFR